MLNKLVTIAGTSVLLALSTIVGAAETAVLIISHEVADYAAWKKSFDAGKANREKAGLSERYVMRDLDRPNFIIVVFDPGTPQNAKRFVSDPAFKERINKASISGPAEIRIGFSDPQ